MEILNFLSCASKLAFLTLFVCVSVIQEKTNWIPSEARRADEGTHKRIFQQAVSEFKFSFAWKRGFVVILWFESFAPDVAFKPKKSFVQKWSMANRY